MTSIKHIDYYFNEDGLMVLTAKYLEERGFCCGNGCRHCPYNYERVPEPKKSALREGREREWHSLLKAD